MYLVIIASSHYIVLFEFVSPISCSHKSDICKKSGTKYFIRLPMLKYFFMNDNNFIHSLINYTRPQMCLYTPIRRAKEMK